MFARTRWRARRRGSVPTSASWLRVSPSSPAPSTTRCGPRRTMTRPASNSGSRRRARRSVALLRVLPEARDVAVRVLDPGDEQSAADVPYVLLRLSACGGERAEALADVVHLPVCDRPGESGLVAVRI